MCKIYRTNTITRMGVAHATSGGDAWVGGVRADWADKAGFTGSEVAAVEACTCGSDDATDVAV